MPAPFQRLTLDQFADVLKAFNFRRRITGVHMHHTWRPNHAQWKGHDSMVGMWRFHTQDRGFSDIAQHLTIDPEGQVWTGRNWNAAPASMMGHNGTSLAGPFMFETVGDFDLGRDVLQGAQRKAVLDVIALVQTKFGLAPETLMFHNQAADKTCPGTGIPYADFVQELREHRAALDAAPRSRAAVRTRAVLPLADSALAGPSLVQRTVRLIEPDTASRAAPMGSPMEELDYDHAAEAAASGVAGGGGGSAGRGGGGGQAPTPEQLDALRPYVLNLRMGHFSNDGLMTSSPADVDRIVNEQLRQAAQAAAARNQTLRVVLYAHGGLVKESQGLAGALQQVGWWRDNGVYPIHFVWETGLFETIKSLLERARSPLRQRGLGDWITDRVTDPLLERTARALQTERIWGGMKASARLASEDTGGARLLLRALAGLVQQGLPLELHAVGHSAGSIFHAHLLQAAQAEGLPPFRTLQLMAPAVRADTFAQLVQPLLGAGGGVDALTVYTMRRDFERDDNCAGIYRKSLLYFVSAACEDEVGARILGLEDSLRADPGLRALFGLGQPGSGMAEVVWSRSALTDGRSATQAVRHGDFDNDAPTMNSVLRRVLGLDDAAPLAKPFPGGPGGSRGGGDPWADSVDWPPEFDMGGGGSATAAPAPSPASAPAPAPAAPAAASPAAPFSGRRLALCVGIDNYPTAPLSGCQNDARLWQQTLQALGFQAELLLDPPRQALFGAIEDLFTRAQPGDEVVLQYAGHGTYLQDIDGDEAGGDSPDRDEALCPVDFDSGALLIDDDIGALIDRMAAGARLTMFMDCCHSGTVSRVGGSRAPAPPLGSKARFVRPTAALNRAHRAWRETQGHTPGGVRGLRPELVFSACKSTQVAWESGGHGEFTLRATGVLAQGGARLAPVQVHQQVLAAFGPQPRQDPQLEGPDERKQAPLFLGVGAP